MGWPKISERCWSALLLLFLHGRGSPVENLHLFFVVATYRVLGPCVVLGECACGWQSEPQVCIPEWAVWWWPLRLCVAHSKTLYTLMWVARTRFWERFLLCHWCFSCNRPLALRGHVTNAKIERARENDLIPEIWEETHLREIFYGTLIFQQSSMICFSYHRGWFLEGWSTNLHSQAFPRTLHQSFLPPSQKKHSEYIWEAILA